MLAVHLSVYTDKGRVGAASHEDDNKTPRYLELPVGGYSLPVRTFLFKQGDVWRGWPGDVRRAFGVKNREAARSPAAVMLLVV